MTALSPRFRLPLLAAATALAMAGALFLLPNPADSTSRTDSNGDGVSVFNVYDLGFSVSWENRSNNQRNTRVRVHAGGRNAAGALNPGLNPCSGADYRADRISCNLVSTRGSSTGFADLEPNTSYTVSVYQKLGSDKRNSTWTRIGDEYVTSDMMIVEQTLTGFTLAVARDSARPHDTLVFTITDTTAPHDFTPNNWQDDTRYRVNLTTNGTPSSFRDFVMRKVRHGEGTVTFEGLDPNQQYWACAWKTATRERTNCVNERTNAAPQTTPEEVDLRLSFIDNCDNTVAATWENPRDADSAKVEYRIDNTGTDWGTSTVPYITAAESHPSEYWKFTTAPGDRIQIRITIAGGLGEGDWQTAHINGVGSGTECDIGSLSLTSITAGSNCGEATIRWSGTGPSGTTGFHVVWKPVGSGNWTLATSSPIDRSNREYTVSTGLRSTQVLVMVTTIGGTAQTSIHGQGPTAGGSC